MKDSSRIVDLHGCYAGHRLQPLIESPPSPTELRASSGRHPLSAVCIFPGGQKALKNKNLAEGVVDFLGFGKTNFKSRTDMKKKKSKKRRSRRRRVYTPSCAF